MFELHGFSPIVEKTLYLFYPFCFANLALVTNVEI